jgi:hypothetical protein
MVFACLAPAARAGEVVCHYEGGVMVAPARVAGIAGDFILDTGSAHTVLDATRAASEGFTSAEITGTAWSVRRSRSPWPIWTCAPGTCRPRWRA